MTAKDRERHEANQARQNPALPSEGGVLAPGRTDTWLARNIPSKNLEVVWLIRPMPDGQWPPDQSLPRDDSFAKGWLVRSHCGHQGGAKLWAFYEKRYAEMYEGVFRDDPCRWTRCPDRIMIENDGRRR